MKVTSLCLKDVPKRASHYPTNFKDRGVHYVLEAYRPMYSVLAGLRQSSGCVLVASNEGVTIILDKMRQQD